MNLGLGNLDDLKKFIIQESIRSQDDWDQIMQTLGKGVSTLFERHCNRWFARTAGAVDSFTADRDVWWLSRFPVETITSVEIKDSDASGWQTLPAAVEVSDLERGRLDFGGLLGSERSRVRVTYTGGYWFETLEPSQEGYPSAMPAGAFGLPDDLRSAWLMQCQQIFEGKDHTLPKYVAGDGQAEIHMNLRDVALIPAVKETLQGFVRYQMT